VALPVTLLFPYGCELIVLRKPVPGVSSTALARFTSRAQKEAGLRGELAVLVTNNREIQSLNRDFRKKDKPTDVISFPSEASGVAGDIAISADIAKRNGLELGHDVLTELKILILHGILHLAGFDHETDGGEMSRKEIRLRKQLGLPSGLIERTNGSKPAKAARGSRP
jgi:probable rRNA maturation factor